MKPIHNKRVGLFKTDCGNYKDIWLWENDFILLYLESYDILILADYLRHGDAISQGMRNFIADVLEGKFKRPRGKKTSTIRRDIQIYSEINRLLYEGKQLTSNKKGDVAAAIVGESFQVEEDVVIKAVSRVKEKLNQDGSLAVYKANGEIISFELADIPENWPDPGEFD